MSTNGSASLGPEALPAPTGPRTRDLHLSHPPYPARRTVLAGVLALTSASVLGGQVATARRAYAAARALSSTQLDVAVDEATGGLFRLVNPQDKYRTNFVLNPDNRPNFVVDDSRWLGDMVFSVKRADEAAPRAAVTSLSDDTRTVTSTTSSIQVAYAAGARNPAGLRDFSLTQIYRLAGNDQSQLSWTFTITNASNVQLELLDVAFPLPMNSWWAEDQTTIYEQNVGRHSHVAQDGSYIYWQRPNGEAPYLVMTPQPGTSLEFKNKARYGEGPFAEQDPAWEGLVEYFVHSKNAVAARADRAAQYLPATSLVLAPGASKTYGFTFRWASSYQNLRDVLADAGVADVISMPGMVIPTDLKATVAIRATGGVTSVTGQSGKNITITSRGTRGSYSLFDITLPTLGANTVTIVYGQNRKTVLQYWAIEPVEKVIAARSTFLATRQQAKTSRGYDGAFLQWDMTRQKLITWDDYPGGGWKEWMAGGSDDLGLGPAAYLARKNVDDPVQAEVNAVDYFIQKFLLGYLQNRTENGQRTYQVYRWFDGRDGSPSDQGVWRAYNYIHIANVYFHMYELASSWPTLRTAFSAADYLSMCFKTLEAMFTKIPLPTPIGDAAHDLGLMGESTYPEVLAALDFEGRAAEATRLRSFLEAKRDRIFAQKYPFASEASIDTTGFETDYTLAKMYGDRELADKVQRASLACRGLQPLWYFYGSDNRHMGESWWNLGYQTHLGAWQQQDYLFSYAAPGAADFDDMMRSTYGAYLGGWANINSGQISAAASNYGAASWQFQSEKGPCNYDHIPILDGWWGWSGEADLGFWGGVRTACAHVVNDSVVGLFAYGADVALSNGTYTITPRDGVRQRLRVHPANRVSIDVRRGRYTRAQVSQSADRVVLTLQRPRGGASSPRITLANLSPGLYDVSINTAAPTAQLVSDGRETSVALKNIPDGATVTIARRGEAPAARRVLGAAATASYTAAWNRVAALTDARVAPSGDVDQDALWGSYRGSARPASETLTLGWSQPVTLSGASLTFWNDSPAGSGDGVALPASWRLEYRDPTGTWRAVSVSGAGTYPINAAGSLSSVTFAAISTVALRATLQASRAAGGLYSALAVSDWSVYST